ncbi:class II fructose-bisphosphate aldolase [candidate division KSB1 bacterium]|nr:class II fructose-bisphosphate aldolase [candidate division KSB1 bacterium]
MPFASLTEMLKKAQQGQYALGAFNVMNLEYLHSIIETAEQERSPVILQINPIHFKHSRVASFISYIREEAINASVPVALNLDHGNDRQVILYAIRNGFPAVMFDGSKLSYEENILQTKQITEICHPLGIPVEAELGKLNDEGVEITPENRSYFFTDPVEAKEFVNITNVDALAVSIGNAHGFYKGDPEIDFQRLDEIRHKVVIPLVLHGGSGISDDDIRRAISCGICKINIYTEMGANASIRLRQIIAEHPEPFDLPWALLEIRAAIREIVRHKIQLFGSAGKSR